MFTRYMNVAIMSIVLIISACTSLNAKNNSYRNGLKEALAGPGYTINPPYYDYSCPYCYTSYSTSYPGTYYQGFPY